MPTVKAIVVAASGAVAGHALALWTVLGAAAPVVAQRGAAAEPVEVRWLNAPVAPNPVAADPAPAPAPMAAEAVTSPTAPAAPPPAAATEPPSEAVIAPLEQNAAGPQPTSAAAPTETTAASDAARTDPNGFDYVPREFLSVVPKPLEDIEVPFPETTSAGDFRTTLQMSLFIDESGQVQRVRVDGSAPTPELEKAARSAFERARFTPGRLDGQAVRSLIRVEVTFESRALPSAPPADGSSPR